jgi:hypothetical protein
MKMVVMCHQFCRKMAVVMVGMKMGIMGVISFVGKWQ